MLSPILIDRWEASASAEDAALWVWAARLAVAAVFGLAAWGKSVDQAAARQAVEDFGVPPRFVRAAAWSLPAAELAVAAAVLPAASAVFACWAALVLLAGFTGAIAAQLRRGDRPSCSCFGAMSTEPISSWTLARNAAIAALIAAALWGTRSYGDAVRQLPTAEALGLAALVLVAALQVRQAATTRALRSELATLRATLPAAEGLPIRAVAPAFTLLDLGEQPRTLTDLVTAGRPVVLVFLHPACGPCKLTARELARLQADGGGRHTVVAVGSGDLATNAAWAREHGLETMLVQIDNEVAGSYRLRGTPTAVLIDSRGRIAAPPARGPREISELLAGITPNTLRT